MEFSQNSRKSSSKSEGSTLLALPVVALSPGGSFGHRRRGGARLAAHARLRRRWESLRPRSSEAISATASSFLASALAMAIVARWTAEREMSVAPAIMRMLRPAFTRSSTIKRRRAVSAAVPVSVPLFAALPRLSRAGGPLKAVRLRWPLGPLWGALSGLWARRWAAPVRGPSASAMPPSCS